MIHHSYTWFPFTISHSLIAHHVNIEHFSNTLPFTVRTFLLNELLFQFNAEEFYVFLLLCNSTWHTEHFQYVRFQLNYIFICVLFAFMLNLTRQWIRHGILYLKCHHHKLWFLFLSFAFAWLNSPLVVQNVQKLNLLTCAIVASTIFGGNTFLQRKKNNVCVSAKKQQQ